MLVCWIGVCEILAATEGLYESISFEREWEEEGLYESISPGRGGAAASGLKRSCTHG